MSKSKIDNKVLETYSDTILESLQKRVKELKLDELPKVRRKISDAQSRTYVGGKRVTKIVGLTQEEFKALVTIRKALEREQKNARRAVGALIQNKGQIYQKVLDKIRNNKLTGKQITNAIKVFQAQPTRLGGIGHDYDPKIKKVGHAPVGLNVLPDAMEMWLTPFNKTESKQLRNRFLDLAKKNGLTVGDEWLNFIDPAAHKPFTTITTGVLEQRFGLNAKDIPKDFLEDLYKKQAHATLFGGTSGIKVPAISDLKGLDADAFFKAVTPYLELPYMGNKTASELEKVLMNSANLSTTDLAQAIRNIPIDPNAAELSERLKFINTVSPKDLIVAEETGQIAAASRLSDAPHLLKHASKVNIGKKLLKAAPLPVVSSLLAPSIVKAAEERQEENPNIVNWTQLQLERASQFGTNLSTAGLAGVVTPEPVTTVVGAGAVAVGETIDTAASVPSLLIDAARYAVDHAQNPLTDEELQKEFQKTDDYLGPNFATL